MLCYWMSPYSVIDRYVDKSAPNMLAVVFVCRLGYVTDEVDLCGRMFLFPILNEPTRMLGINRLAGVRCIRPYDAGDIVTRGIPGIV